MTETETETETERRRTREGWGREGAKRERKTEGD